MSRINRIVAYTQIGDDLEVRKDIDEGGVDDRYAEHPLHGLFHLFRHQRGVGALNSDETEILFQAARRKGRDLARHKEGGKQASFRHEILPLAAGCTVKPACALVKKAKPETPSANQFFADR